MSKRKHKRKHISLGERIAEAPPPAEPLCTERGYWREEGEDRLVWFAFDVSRLIAFQVAVGPRQVILRLKCEQNSAEFRRLSHEAFAQDADARQWVRAAHGESSLMQVDAEISRLDKCRSSGLPYGPDIWGEGQIEFEGRIYDCLQRTTVQTRTSVFTSDDEVIIDHWWYHPQYDEEPNTRIERFPIRGFMKGEGQSEVLENFGTGALDRLLQNCRMRWPGLAVRDIRQIAASGGARSGARTALGSWLAGMASRLDQYGEALLSRLALGGFTLILLLVAAGTMFMMAEPLSWWWHGRIADDLVEVRSEIVSHETLVETQSISDGPKRANRKLRYVYFPRVGFRIVLPASDGDPAVVHSSQGMPQLAGRQETQEWMSLHFPLGASHVLWFRPGKTAIPGDSFIVARQEIPSGWSLLLELLVDTLLVGFIYLPLAVLALLLLGVAFSALSGMFFRRGKS